jgi:hypothetical protein
MLDALRVDFVEKGAGNEMLNNLHITILIYLVKLIRLEILIYQSCATTFPIRPKPVRWRTMSE